MASTLGVGAPNAYYKNTIKALCSLPPESTSGAEVAALIMDFERDDQFNNYICYDNAAFPNLISTMKDYARLWPPEHERGTGSGIAVEPDLVIGDERIYDIVKILGADQRPQAKAVADCIQKEFVVCSRVSSRIDCQCGPPAVLTTLAPDNESLRDEYRDHPVYKETEWNRVTFSLVNER
jgi:hypothetical protein